MYRTISRGCVDCKPPTAHFPESSFSSDAKTQREEQRGDAHEPEEAGPGRGGTQDHPPVQQEPRRMLFLFKGPGPRLSQLEIWGCGETQPLKLSQRVWGSPCEKASPLRTCRLQAIVSFAKQLGGTWSMPWMWREIHIHLMTAKPGSANGSWNVRRRPRISCLLATPCIGSHRESSEPGRAEHATSHYQVCRTLALCPNQDRNWLLQTAPAWKSNCRMQ